MRKPKEPTARSRLAKAIAEGRCLQFQACGLPKPVAELRFFDGRKWQFDFAWVEQKVALEVEGGVYVPGGGGHQRVGKFLAQMEKYNMATLKGWRVFRCIPNQIFSMDNIAMLKQAIRKLD